MLMWKSVVFWFCKVLTHARWSETFWYAEMRYSSLVNLMQKLLKSVNICKSCCRKITATFLCPTVYNLAFPKCMKWLQKTLTHIRISVTSYDNRCISKVSNNVLIKVTLSRQRHCRGTVPKAHTVPYDVIHDLIWPTQFHNPIDL